MPRVSVPVADGYGTSQAGLFEPTDSILGAILLFPVRADVQPMNVDFLSLKPDDPKLKNVTHLLVDPSCCKCRRIRASRTSNASEALTDKHTPYSRIGYSLPPRPPHPLRSGGRTPVPNPRPVQLPTRDRLARAPVLGRPARGLLDLFSLGARRRRGRDAGAGQEGDEGYGVEIGKARGSVADLGAKGTRRGLRWRYRCVVAYLVSWPPRTGS